MKNPIEQVLEGQKQFFDYWAKIAQEVPANGKAKKPETAEQILTEFYEKQKQVFQEALKIGDPQEAFGKAPEQFSQWMEVQKEFADKWMQFYKSQAAEPKFQIPGFESWEKLGQDSSRSMNWWLDEASKWMQQQVMAKMPFNMQPHMGNFQDLYKNMYENWENMQKMIRQGTSNLDAVGAYFNNDTYQDLVNKMMGFQPVGDARQVMDAANTFFGKWIDAVQQFNPKSQDLSNAWKKALEQFSGRDPQGGSQLILDMGAFLQQQMDSMYQVTGQGKESKMAAMLKDAQFAYLQFVVKSSELQSLVYQSGQFALPDTIRHFYQSWNQDATMPEFETFLNQYIDTLEGYLMEVLRSDAYSTLQAEVAKGNAEVRAKMEEFMYAALENTPFLLKKHGNDIALESAALRRKVRTVEARVAELEAKLEQALKALSEKTPAPVAKAAAPAPSATTTVAARKPSAKTTKKA